MRNFFTASLFALLATPVLAQTPTLEFFTGVNNPTGNGPSVSSQLITFQNNASNPNDNAATDYSPTTTVTFSLSNQQYGTSDARRGIMFGSQTSNGTAPASYALFPTTGALSGATSGQFTSASGVSGGIDAGVNRSVELGTDIQYTGAQTAARNDWYADLTLTFSQAVVNPVLHFTGLGVQNNAVGASTELTLLTADVTLSKLTGSTILNVSDTQITNTATNPDTGGNAANGSVLATTPASGVTSLTFRVYLRKRAGSMFGSGAVSFTDGWLLGVSARTPATPLPVTLVDFTAHTTATGAVQLAWQTASEVQNAYFEVERSLDGTQFVSVGRVAGQGSKAITTTYALTDAAAGLPNAQYLYYRLRQVDYSGESTYSPVRTVSRATPDLAFTVWPNPAAAGPVQLDARALPTSTYQVNLFNATGQIVYATTIAGGQAATLSLPTLPTGFYIMQLRGRDLTTPVQLSQRLLLR